MGDPLDFDEQTQRLVARAARLCADLAREGLSLFEQAVVLGSALTTVFSQMPPEERERHLREHYETLEDMLASKPDTEGSA
jgi:hypothetical protein